MKMKVIHTVDTDIVKLVVEIESFDMSSDEFDKDTGSSDEFEIRNIACSSFISRKRMKNEGYPSNSKNFTLTLGNDESDRNDIIWLMASMGPSPCLNTGTVRHKSSGGNLEVLMIECLSIVETNKVIHIVEIDIVKLVVEIESFGMSADEFDKETGSSDGLQPKQADLSCVHALNELHLHEIHVVPSKHEADQYVHVIE
ncbi:hypothetical protein Tco_0604522 [Tanacetum coccineum]